MVVVLVDIVGWWVEFELNWTRRGPSCPPFYTWSSFFFQNRKVPEREFRFLCAVSGVVLGEAGLCVDCCGLLAMGDSEPPGYASAAPEFVSNHKQ